MQDAHFTIVVPTIGRSQLRLLVDSIPNSPDLELIVVGDSRHQIDWIDEPARQRPFMFHRLAGGEFGAPQRDLGIIYAKPGSYLIHMDDNDLLHPDALTNLRTTVRSLSEPKPILCQVETHGNNIIDHMQPIEVGHVDGHQLIVPNLPGKVGAWGEGDWKADWSYIESTLHLWPKEKLVRVPYIVARAG